MALSPGTRLGPYQISAQIGVGGMGEVYQATDTKLGRQVAIKVLPESVASDPDRLARFDREAKTLAALNHPNIAAIHGLEESGGAIALVMELVEGPTLADRIAAGAIPIDEALPIARQIAEALEAAHERGIIHRDLKPANVKVRPDGTVKVLDFGLAKAMEPPGAMSSSVSQAPTITTPAMTQAGMILGTAAYMSPEQACGAAVDRRADIWAFGVVLWEMLTGTRLFDGVTVSDTLAGVLKTDPDFGALPTDVPARVRQTLRLCLRKDAKERVGDVRDARLALEGAFETTGSLPAAPASSRRTRSLALVLASVVLAGMAASVGTWMATRPGAQPVTRFVHSLVSESFSRNGRPVLAISRDGRRVVYVANSQLYLRNLDDPIGRPIPGTSENPSSPAFSPDGEQVAFWSSENALKRIAVSGGTAVRLTDAENPMGVSWELDGTIVYGQSDGIWRVSANGGQPDQLVATAEGEQIHGPQLLPGGNALLFATTTTSGADGWDEADVVVQGIGADERTVLVSGGAFPRYVPSGHLIYAQGDTLFAQPFRPDARAVSGGPVPVVSGVMRAPSSDIGIAQYAFSDTGALAYVAGTGGAIVTGLMLTDRNGTSRALPNSSGLLTRHPRFSPDGMRIAATRENATANDSNVWIYEVTESQWRQLTFDGGSNPIWTADGSAVAFTVEGELWQVASDFGGEPEPFQGTAAGAIPNSWSADGTLLYSAPGGFYAYRAGAGATEGGTLVLPPGDAEEVFNASFSPGGRWVAYAAVAGGPPEVYVRPYPFDTGGRRRITNSGGDGPRWSRDGRELFVVAAQGLLAFDVTTEPTLAWANPTMAFPVPAGALPLTGPTDPAGFDVSPDAEQMVAVVLPDAGLEGETAILGNIQIVLGWFDELERLVPTD